MSAPFGMYGGYKYESPESRALGSITPEQYSKVYEDQAQFIGKMVNDVSYMAAYMRKMQKGIDQANENIIQQIQDFINDLIVILGGGGDTGFDFGDLKYVFQAVGALFGFANEDGSLKAPIDVFEAAWHFIENLILPNGDFSDFINQLIDAMLATILDIFGEIPILGQAAQQLAVWISDVRDWVVTLDDWIQSVIDAITGFTDGVVSDIVDFFTGLPGSLGSLLEQIVQGFTGLLGDWGDVGDWIDGFLGDILALFGLGRGTSKMGPNLCSNPGFESSDFYLGNVGVYSTTKKHSGTQSALVTTTNGPTQTVQLTSTNVAGMNIPCAGGDTLYGEYWVYPDDANVSNVGTWLQLSILHENGSWTNSSVVPGGTSTKGAWGKLVGKVTLPSTAVAWNAYLCVGSGTTTTGDKYYFDDVQVEKYTHTQSLLDAITGGVGDFISDVVDFFTGLPGSIGSLLEQIVEGFTGLFGDWDDVGDWIATLLPWNWFNLSQRDRSNWSSGSDFEDGTLDPWSVGTDWSVASDQKHAGTYSAKHVGGSAGICNLESSPFTVQDGDVFTVEAWARRDSAYNGGGNSRIRFVDHDTGSTIFNGALYFRYNVELTAVDTWVKLSTTFTISGGVQNMDIKLVADNTAGTLWVDDIIIRRVTEPQNIIDAITGGTLDFISDVVAFFAGLPGSIGSLLEQIVQGFTGLLGDWGDVGDWIATLFPWVTFGVSRNSIANMVLDPGFEDADNWPAATEGSQSTTYKHSGTYSWKTTAIVGAYRSFYLNDDPRPGGATSESKLWRVQQGDTYYIEAWYYAPVSNTATTGSIRLNFAVKNSTTSAWSYYIVDEDIVGSSYVKGTWTKLSGYFTVPNVGQDRIAPYVQMATSFNAADDVYWDDVVVREVTHSQNLLEAITGGVGDVVADVVAFFTDLPASIGSLLEQIVEGFTGLFGDWGDIDDWIASIWTGWKSNLIPGGDNFCTNPEFADTSFYLGSATYSTDVTPVMGTYTAKVQGLGGAATAPLRLTTTYDDIISFPTAPSAKYYYEYWFRGASANVSNTGTINMIFGERTAEDVYLTASGGASITCSTSYNGVWTKASGYVTLHSTSTIGRLYLYIGVGSLPTSDYYYFDGVVVREAREQSVAEYITGVAGDWLSDVADFFSGIVATGGSILDQFVTALTSLGGDFGDITTWVNTLLGVDLFNESTSSAGNLMLSPGFEDSSIVRNHYGTPNKGYTTAQYKAGAQSYYWQPSTLSWHGVYFSPNETTLGHKCNEGDRFHIRAWIKPDAANGTTGYVKLYLRFREYPGGPYQDQMYDGDYPFLLNASAMTGSWQQMEAIGTCPAGKTLVDAFIVSDPTTPTSYKYYIDQVSVRQEREVLNLIDAITGVANDVVSDVVSFFDGIIRTGGSILDQFVTALTSLGGDFTDIETWVETLFPWVTFSKVQRNNNLAPDPNVDHAELWDVGGIFSVGTNVIQATMDASGGVLGFLRNPDGNDIAWDYGYLPVKAGQVWRMSCDIKRVSGTTPSSVVLRYRGIDSAGGNTWASQTFDVTSTSFTNIEYTRTMTTEVKLSPRIEFNTGSVAVGNVYQYTNMRVVEVTEPQNILDAITGGILDTISDITGFFDGIFASAGSILDQFVDALTGLTGGFDAIVSWALDLFGISSIIPVANVSTRDPENLVSGSDFEGLDGVTHPWNLGSGWSIATDQKYSGSYSVKWTAGSGTGACSLSSYRPEGKPGDKLYYEFWARRTSTYNGTGSNSKLRFADQNGNFISSTSYGTDAIEVADTWTFFSGISGALQSGDTAWSITMNQDATAGSIWLDDIVIRRVKAQSTIPDVVREMSSDLQSAIDNVAQAIFGGSSTGNAPAVIKTGLKAIPAANITPPPSPSGTSVGYVSQGAGATTNSTLASSRNVTWSETIGATANFTAVTVLWVGGWSSDPARYDRTVTIGGVEAQSLGVQATNGTHFLEIFGLEDPPTGARTVSVTVAQASGQSVLVSMITGQSQSFSNVQSAGAVSSYANSTASASFSQTVSSTTGRYLVHAFAAKHTYTEAFSAYNQTQSRLANSIYAYYDQYSNNQAYFAFVTGRAAGAASVTFSATASGASGRYGLALELVPASTDLIGSGIRRYRSSTTAVALSSASSGSLFSSNWFDGSAHESEDLDSYNSSTNAYTITHSGWYSVTINVVSDGDSVALFSGGATAAAVYVNGSVKLRGAGIYSNSNTGQNGFSNSFILFLKAGDVVAPGYWSTWTTGSSFIGDSSGIDTWWSLSLLNRSVL